MDVMNFRVYFLAALAMIFQPAFATIINPFTWFTDPQRTMTDVSQTSVTTVAKILKPQTIKDLQAIVAIATCPISIAGGRFSQGGQIAYPQGIVVDITGLNKVISLDIASQEITVESGITWAEIQKHIAPHNLSVAVMQSYNDFTVGGSLGVNVHGRDIHHGPLIETVKSFDILMANGFIKTASRTQNPDLFAGAIGGYGALGIITKVTLSLTPNIKIQRSIKQMPLEEYPQYFLETIKKNPKAVLHNADLYPSDFKHLSSITWCQTDASLTNTQPLQTSQKFYPGQLLAEQALRRISPLHKLRPSMDAKTKQTEAVVWRNFEMSSSVKSLEPLVRFPTTSVLQEYFIPINNLLPFVARARALTKAYGINIINISIRYIPKNDESMLSYAQKESFSLVFYINILNTEDGLDTAQVWTRKLIDAALAEGGTYYLPYQLFGTRAQVAKAYPRLDEFVALKNKYDPQHQFSNNFLNKYGI
ncbi:FAD-binding oxidoreductase [soil metagenome]